MGVMTRYVYPAMVEGAESGGYSLFFPDLACFTAADDLAGLAAMAREALQLHLEGMIDDGQALPAPSSLEALRGDPENNGLGVMLVEADLDGRPTGMVVHLPEDLVRRVDDLASARSTTRDEVLREGAEALLKAG